MWLWVENRFVILIVRLMLCISSSSLDALVYSCSACASLVICMHVQSPLHLVSNLLGDPPASWLKPKCHLLEASKYCIAPTERHLVFIFLTWGVWFDRMSIMHISSSFIRLLVWVKRKQAFSSSQLDRGAVDCSSNAVFFSLSLFRVSGS